MARKRTARHPKPTEPEAQPQGGGQEGHGIAPSDPDAISKSQAAREAIAAGVEAPDDAVEFIRKKFGIEMSKAHFSAVKSQTKKKADAPKAKRGRKPKAVVEGYLAPPPKLEPTGEGDLLDALAAMKPLIAQYGADKVKKMVDLLG